MKRIAMAAVFLAGLGGGREAAAQALYKTADTNDLNQLSSWSVANGSQSPNPSSFTASDTWYFNEVTMQGSRTVSLGGDIALGGMALDWVTGNADNNLTILAGGTITLNGGTLYGNGASPLGGVYNNAGILLNRGTGGSLTIRPAVALGASQAWVTGRNVAGPALTVSGDIALSSHNLNLNITGNTSSTSTFSGAIGGSGKITKYGAATLVISGSNSFSGGFQLGPDAGGANVGIVIAGHADALGTGPITSRGTQLQAGAPGLVFTNPVSVGAGGFRLGGTNDFAFSGATVVDNASRSIQHYGTSTVTMEDIDLTAGPAAMASFEAGKFVVNGSIAGSGAVRTQGATLTLNGVNSYTGTTTVNNAAARLNLNGSLNSPIQVTAGRIAGTGSTAQELVMSGGSLVLAGGSVTNALTVNGATFNGAVLVYLDAPPVSGVVYDVFTYGNNPAIQPENVSAVHRGTLADDPANLKYTFTAGEYGVVRTWNAADGAWDIGVSVNWQEGDQKFYNGDVVRFGEPAWASAVTLVGRLAPSSVLVSNDVNDYTVAGTAGTADITGSASLTKSGAGTLKLATQQSYTGGTTVDGGVLDLTGGGGTGGTIRGVVTVNTGAVLRLNSGDVLGYNNDATAVNEIRLVGGAMTTAAGANQTTTAKIYLAGGTIDGTVNLDLFSNNSRITTYASDNPSTIAVTTMNLRQNDTVFDIADGAAAQDLTVSSILGNGSAGNHNMIKNGAGTMALTSQNTFQGHVTINAGVLDVTAGKLYNAAYDNTRIVTVNTGGALRLTYFTYDADGSLGKLADYAARRVLNGGAIEVVGATHLSGNDFTVTAAGGTFRYAPPGGVSDTLTLNGNANDNIQLGGPLTMETAGNVLVNEILQGAGGLVKTGAGMLELAGANVYGGATVVNAGLLRVNGDQSSATGAVTVAAGGTLGGTGTVGGAVTLLGTASPGTSVGELTAVGDVTFSAGSVLAVEVDAFNGGADRLSVGGALGGSGATLALAATIVDPAQSPYTLVSYGSGGSPFSAVTGVPANWYVVDDSLNKSIVLTTNAGPVGLASFVVMAEGGSVVVRWRTLLEVGTAGFDVYRKAGGDWVKINAETIPAAGVGGAGASYEYIDAAAAPGGAYEYKVVELLQGGGTREYGPYARTATEFRLEALTRPAGTGMDVRWISREGETYRVMASVNLPAGFAPAATNLPATPPENAWTDTNGLPFRVYRIELE